MAKARKKPPPRTRRTAEDARTAILDAAEQRLVESGASGIRLQDVAADVGISHPTVLHHFGSRDRLVDAVVKRRVQLMNQEVLLALVGAGTDERSAVALFERLYTMFSTGGHARVAAFVALEGRIPGADPNSLRPLAEVTHQARITQRHEGPTPPSFEDTYFTVLLAAFALFGEAIVGPIFRGDPEGAPDEVTSKRFREWTARLVLEHFKRGGLATE